MNRIICDICGTAYHDSTAGCPICGYSRENADTETMKKETAQNINGGTSGAASVAEAEAPATEDTAETGTAEVKSAAQKAPVTQETPAPAGVTAPKAEPAAPRPVTKTKGGHFSKKNVKKRLSNTKAVADRDSDDEGKNRGMKWLVAVLAIALLLVCGYIGNRLWQNRNDGGNTPEESTTENTEDITLTEDPSVACVQLDINMELLELTELGATVNLGVTAYPEDTTDVITYSSDDESVVTVDENGNVTAVAPGSAVITITCGDITRECMVSCSFAEETGETTEQTEETTEDTEETTEATEETGTLELSKSDVTLFYKGESFSITPTYNGKSVALAGVTWTSSDESVAIVENGKVTGVGSGKCRITASYNGVEKSCVVRCSFKDESTETTETTETTAATDSPDSGWSISKEDVTLTVDESFTLKITNSAGEIADASWSATTSGVVSIDGTTVTALKSGTTTLSATVDGVTYSCIVRVK